MATKKKTSKKKQASPPPTPIKRNIPRQVGLPGMEDTAIKAIENAALDYVEVRDQRQKLTAQESSLKQELLTLMHREKKTEYRRNGFSVKVIVEKEKVQVRVKEEGEFPAAEAPARPEKKASKKKAAAAPPPEPATESESEPASSGDPGSDGEEMTLP